jgi:hypothetical protein
MRKAMKLGLALTGIAMLIPEPAAALRWGELSQTGCIFTTDPQCPNGSRKYSAILWDIPWGKSWEQACSSTPHPKFNRVPDFCETKLNEWGNWYARDLGCTCQKSLPGGSYRRKHKK